jgi:hypothetical protein
VLSHSPKKTSSSFHTLERRSIVALLDIKKAKKIVLVVLTKRESSEIPYLNALVSFEASSNCWNCRAH